MARSPRTSLSREIMRVRRSLSALDKALVRLAQQAMNRESRP
jgi:hypothetical protein